VEMSRTQSIFNRAFGIKPGPDAPKLDRLLWFRTYYLRSLGLVALGIVVVILFLPPWIAAVVLLPWLLGFARLTAKSDASANTADTGAWPWPEKARLCGLFLEWARLDSNQGPTDYESAALTI
jgi:hypothetical protein